MYFIPKNSWLFYYGIKISSFTRYIITVITLLIFLMGWYFLVFNLCSRVEKNYEASISQLKIQLETQGTLQKEFAVHESKYEAYKQDLKKLFQQQKSYDEYMSLIFDWIQKHDLILQSYAPSTKIKKPWYDKIPILYSVDGTFNNIVLFLESLGRCPLLLGNISTCSLQKLHNDKLRFTFCWNTLIIDEFCYA